MGYFSNGTEGEMYHDAYCSRCVHWPADPADGMCAVWLAHQLLNYKECNNAESALHILIPRNKDRHFNEECRMFIAAPSMGLPFDGPPESQRGSQS